MGDPRKIRRKYSGPRHPWQKKRIEEEKKLLKEYGLKNKTELWKTASKLKGFSSQAKKLIAARGFQAEKEIKQLLAKLQRLGLVKKDSKLDDVLSLSLKDLLERRLQTVLVRKNLARTMKQARQFVTHEHISVNNKKISKPSYLVLLNEDSTISFTGSSSLQNPEHPERKLPETKTATGESKENKK